MGRLIAVTIPATYTAVSEHVPPPVDDEVVPSLHKAPVLFDDGQSMLQYPS